MKDIKNKSFWDLGLNLVTGIKEQNHTEQKKESRRYEKHIYDKFNNRFRERVSSESTELFKKQFKSS